MKHIVPKSLMFWIVSIFMTLFFMALLFFKEPLDYRTQSYANSGDQRLNMLFHQWNVDWWKGSLPEDTGSYWNFYIFHPYQKSLALSSNHLGSLPINLVLDLIENDWFARGNLWIYLCFFLNAVSCYIGCRLIFRKYCRDLNLIDQILISSVISTSFSFSLNRINYIDHAQTLPSFAIPIFLLFAYKSVREYSLWSTCFAALFFSWQAYLDLHITIMVVFLSVITLPAFFSFKQNVISWARLTSMFVLFITVNFLLLWPLIEPYLETVEIFGTRGFVRGPSMKFYFRPTHYSNILKDIFSLRSSNDNSVLPHFVFIPGLFIVSYSMLYSSFMSVKNGSRKDLWKNLSLMFILGTYMDFIVHRSNLAYLFTYSIPGLSSIRTPGRLSILLGPIFFVIVSILFYQRRSERRLKIARSCLLLCLISFSIEVGSIKWITWTRPEHHELREVFKSLKGPSIFIPYSDNPILNLDLMMYAQEYGIKIGNGYSGWMPEGYDELLALQNNFSTRELSDHLSRSYFYETIIDLDRIQDPSAIEGFGRKVGHYIIVESKKINTVENWRETASYFPWLGL